MPHLIETIKDKAKIKKALWGPVKDFFSDEEIDRAECLEMLGSSFLDPGEDWCEYRLVFSATEQKAMRVPGY